MRPCSLRAAWPVIGGLRRSEVAVGEGSDQAGGDAYLYSLRDEEEAVILVTRSGKHRDGFDLDQLTAVAEPLDAQ